MFIDYRTLLNYSFIMQVGAFIKLQKKKELKLSLVLGSEIF